jgi:exosortase/archaeosortase family protein
VELAASGAALPGPGRSATAFIVRFTAVWLAGLILLVVCPQIEARAARGMALLLSGIYAALGNNPQLSGTLLEVGGARAEIVGPCTPLVAIIQLGAAMLAFQARARSRVRGLLIGACLLWVFDVLRVMFMFELLARESPHFGFLHAYVWQVLTVVVVWSIFWIWTRAAIRQEAAP